MITIFDNGELETSNQKNIPKFLVVRDELPANHQGRARMPIPQNWIIFFVEFSYYSRIQESGVKLALCIYK
ncbi:hypothetical protein OA07_06905 [Aphanizomenon flos-aquae 2012/KM1/D3]|uniref:hypothetical protein n=1 Tax=Aphanizomenon flos-aquae TaxID=1176 RepID=UPI0005445337|nr:hypothetical protein [Aphanizomenon flos-aquae]KHG42180.1 hypothetical protein OA07_06905 [Aphanizomenon flos-aquae 2012/KM1/D3]